MAGDARRWINWKASARHSDSLFINEFEQERAVEIGIIVDARSRSNIVAAGRSSFSSSVQAAASLSVFFLAQANRVGLMLYGSHLDWTVPGYGRVQRERIMRVLAKARVGHSRIFDRMKYLPTRLFPPQSQLIFISPVLREDVGFLRFLRAPLSHPGGESRSDLRGGRAIRGRTGSGPGGEARSPRAGSDHA